MNAVWLMLQIVAVIFCKCYEFILRGSSVMPAMLCWFLEVLSMWNDIG
uniref:Uncharacterized protein n=1 Tax=Arundo donax TaxID=35708 RepID=A0A0A9HM73_ARUDO